MPDFFNQVLTDPMALEQELLGPDYPYYKYVATPGEMGMSSDGSMSATADDVAGLINYVQFLVSGTGKANKGGGTPLGDKFFLKTGAQCDAGGGQTVDRYMYINNVPDGSIPFISSGSGISFSSFEGLVPGIMGNLASMNPLTIFQGFMQGSKPACSELTMPTKSATNAVSTETHYVADSDISNIPPCDFPGKKNPKTGVSCREAFTTKQKTKNILKDGYIFVFGLILLYIIQKLLKKN